MDTVSLTVFRSISQFVIGYRFVFFKHYTYYACVLSLSTQEFKSIKRRMKLQGAGQGQSQGDLLVPET